MLKVLEYKGKTLFQKGFPLNKVADKLSNY